MIVDFYHTFRDTMVLNTEAATHLYTGMVTDSGRFKYEGVNGETMRMADHNQVFLQPNHKPSFHL